MNKLFEKSNLASIELKNRFFRSATWEGIANNGHITEQLLKIYEDLSLGGVAGIITGYAFISDDEQPTFGMMGASNDSYIEDFKQLTDMVHSYDTRIFLQIAYGGTQTLYNNKERMIWGPSAVQHKHTKVLATEMTKEDLMTLVQLHADAAVRAKKGGFDGVQFHAAHGYLLSQFLSPYYNRRTDEYGGEVLNRARIIFEILEGVKKAVGDDFPILIKINCSDFNENEGFVFEECKIVCKELENRGINAIEVSGGVAFNPPEGEIFRKEINKNKEDESYFRQYAAEIAREADIPIILVGGNRTPAIMEDILNSTDIKYFSLSRTLLSQPDLINRWKENPQEVPRCISCNKCMSRRGSACILNKKQESII